MQSCARSRPRRCDCGATDNQELPIIGIGDYNFEFDFPTRKGNAAFDCEWTNQRNGDRQSKLLNAALVILLCGFIAARADEPLIPTTFLCRASIACAVLAVLIALRAVLQKRP